jgi:hypothetical protein
VAAVFHACVQVRTDACHDPGQPPVVPVSGVAAAPVPAERPAGPVPVELHAGLAARWPDDACVTELAGALG